MSSHETITVQNCEDEPIHIPGSIQAHGSLIVLDSITLRISHVSETSLTLLCAKKEEVFETCISQWLNDDFVQFLREESKRGFQTQYEPQTVSIMLSPNSKEMIAVVTCNNDQVLIALEPQSIDDTHQYGALVNVMKGALGGLMGVETLETIYDIATKEVKAITGFDRVMLYKFDHEYNGQVISEAKEENLNSFLMQHFPEADIPSQAREMYLKTPVRLLVDAHSKVSPVLPNSPPVDLTLCSLRSVSPIHIQYLKNMGVRATLTISIIVKGKLWGLIACHHYSKKFISFELREIAQYVSIMLSQLISVKLESQVAKQHSDTLSSLGLLSEAVSTNLSISNFTPDGRSLLDLVKANGVAFNIQGNSFVFGDVPASAAIDEIYKTIRDTRLKNGDYYATFQLSRDFKGFADQNNACGLLAVNFASDYESDYIMWFRKEVIETKDWGGKPEKIIQFWDDGTHRLMPRTSFALWKENVRHKSNPWHLAEIEAALKFRTIIMNKLVAESENLKRTNKKLEQEVSARTQDLQDEILQKEEIQKSLEIALKESEASNRELERFAFIASHDLQEPLRKIQTFGDRIQLSNDPTSDKNALYIERMRKSATRMQQLIKDTLSYSRLSNHAPEMQWFDADNAIKTVVDDLSLLIKEKNAQISIGPLGELMGDYLQIQRVFQNLIENAIKFTPAERDPIIFINVAETDAAYTIIEVADNGIGIDEKFSAKVFDLFSRLHGKNEYSGTGLGLTICKKIMINHKGDIWLKSVPGRGTRFYLQLPASSKKDVNS